MISLLRLLLFLALANVASLQAMTFDLEEVVAKPPFATQDQTVEYLKNKIVESAITQAGIYIESEQTLANGEFDEVITQLGGGVVELSDVEITTFTEEVKPKTIGKTDIPGGQFTYIKVKARATVDQEPIKAQLQSLRRNRALEAQNTALIDQLEKLEKALQSKGEANPLDIVHAQQVLLAAKNLSKKNIKEYELTPDLRERLLISNNELNSPIFDDDNIAVAAKRKATDIWGTIRKWVKDNATVYPPKADIDGNIFIDFEYDPLPVKGLLSQWVSVADDGQCLIITGPQEKLSSFDDYVARYIYPSKDSKYVRFKGYPFIGIVQGPYNASHSLQIPKGRLKPHEKFGICYKPSERLAATSKVDGKAVLKFETGLDEKQRRRSPAVNVEFNLLWSDLYF